VGVQTAESIRAGALAPGNGVGSARPQSPNWERSPRDARAHAAACAVLQRLPLAGSESLSSDPALHRGAAAGGTKLIEVCRLLPLEQTIEAQLW
jgi:hypothetical protein